MRVIETVVTQHNDLRGCPAELLAWLVENKRTHIDLGPIYVNKVPYVISTGGIIQTRGCGIFSIENSIMLGVRKFTVDGWVPVTDTYEAAALCRELLVDKPDILEAK